MFFNLPDLGTDEKYLIQGGGHYNSSSASAYTVKAAREAFKSMRSQYSSATITIVNTTTGVGRIVKSWER
jgi:hypothetical protein